MPSIQDVPSQSSSYIDNMLSLETAKVSMIIDQLATRVVSCKLKVSQVGNGPSFQLAKRQTRITTSLLACQASQIKVQPKRPRQQLAKFDVCFFASSPSPVLSSPRWNKHKQTSSHFKHQDSTSGDVTRHSSGTTYTRRLQVERSPLEWVKVDNSQRLVGRPKVASASHAPDEATHSLHPSFKRHLSASVRSQFYNIPLGFPLPRHPMSASRTKMRLGGADAKLASHHRTLCP